MNILKRLLDIVLALVAVLIFCLPAVLIALAIRATSEGPVLYWSRRIGQHNRAFNMPKFRTMWLNTPCLPTHQLSNPQQHLTPLGSFLRKSSLDELPQLWSVMRGEMSLVGPRPALFNEHDLIDLRTQHGVQILLPGLTGWAQVNGRDELPIPQKVAFDVEYLHKLSLWFDLKILGITVFKVFSGAGISH